ncbi:hypothetical protein SMACR_08395 [Sordaria macrospora]|uniref:Uncharacterized protein n=1 Tax=Sordaria macrospora TaxID=5147 RepID=A0A8S8Z9T1_SORMA|nr:hypothetical protein SMACR_08395 [Sordaria macrospora]WPJ62546.1 hypothetical protein SMAC4_08395 [Sordaria macrospora]
MHSQKIPLMTVPRRFHPSLRPPLP